MRYFIDTLSYLFVKGKGKRFLAFFSFALVPSVILAYGLRTDLILKNLFDTPTYNNWPELFFAYFPSKRSFSTIFVALIVFVLSTACISGAVIRHFRVGDFSPKQLGKSFNDYAFPAFLYTAMNLMIYFVAYLLYSFFAYMWYTITSPKAYVALSILSLIAISCAVLYIVSSITTWLPSMCIKGVYSPNSLSTAFYQSRGKQKLFLPGHFFVIFILMITGLISYFVSKVWYVSWIINAVGFAFSYTFSIIFIITAYFGESGLPREDLKVNPYKRRY